MKKSALARIIIYSVITALLVGVLVYGINSNGDINNVFKISTKSYDESGYSKSTSQKIEYNQNEVKAIDIDWTAGKVTITNDPKATKVTVIESASSKLDDDNSLRYKLENDGTLSIKYKKSEWDFSFKDSNISKQLNVVLPSSIYEKIDVDTVSATCEIDGVKTKDLCIDSTSGIIAVKNTQTSLVDCEAISGNMSFDKTNVKKLDCDNTSGKISFDGSVESEIDIDTTSGSVDITSTKCPNKIDTNSVSGSVDINLPKDSQFTAEVSNIGGSFSSNFNTIKNDNNYVCGNGSAEFSFDSVSGGITINSLS